MVQTMQAIAVVPGQRTVRLAEQPIPTLGLPSDVMVRILEVGVCGTDREMRVHVFRYWSARDGQGGLNVGLFTPKAFASRKPSVPETWRCVVAGDGVEMTKKDVFARASFRFARGEFEVRGSLPAPAP